MKQNRRQFLATASALTACQSPRSAASDDSVTVRAPSGVVRGRVIDDLHVFTGIPFGASTAGAARFRPPLPAPSWAGEFDATQPARVPPQPTNFLFPVLPGTPSEDCLQLNIWAPKRPGRYPVFVWIYGGGNLQGSCVEPLFNCAPFARDGIVSVNFNYRLGALGFLELGGILGPEYRGSANSAMRDQLLALEWVKRNIGAFGGDPENVTVAGQSAGGANLVALLGSPTSAGLMNRAIIASGASGVQDLASADTFAELFVEHLGGADRLHTASFDEIIAAQANAWAEWLNELPFRAVIDPVMIPSRPSEAVAAGSARDVELLVSWCRDEMRTLIPESDARNPSFVPRTSPGNEAKMQRLMAAYAQVYPELSHAEIVWRAATAADLPAFFGPALT